MASFPHEEDVRLTGRAAAGDRSFRRRTRGRGAGDREFYGGLAVLTLCSAIAMMRSGPEQSFAGSSPRPIENPAHFADAKAQTADCFAIDDEDEVGVRMPR